jgi:hypothetical protein
MPFGRKHRGEGKKAHGGEAEESFSIASLKANQKVKLIYWKWHSFFITLVHFRHFSSLYYRRADITAQIIKSLYVEYVLALSRVRMVGLAELILILFIDNE